MLQTSGSMDIKTQRENKSMMKYNLFTKTQMIEAEAVTETTRAEQTTDLYGKEDLDCCPKWLPELAWSSPPFFWVHTKACEQHH